MPLDEDKSRYTQNEELNNFSDYFLAQFDDLINLIGSRDVAVGLFLNITTNVKNKQNKVYHLHVVINLFKYYQSTASIYLKNLSTFQNILIEYFKSETVNGKLPPQLDNITKKIYLYMYSINYFFEDNNSKEFTIFDICPKNQKEITNQLFDSLQTHCCNEDVLKATKLFLSSKQVMKNYLRIYVNAFYEISKINRDWSNNAIELGLTNFRDSYTDDESLNTKFHETSRVKELFQHLKRIGLLDSYIRLPRNIKRPGKSSLMRSTNPTISAINVDKVYKEKSLTSAKKLIDEFYEDLVFKLDQLIVIAQDAVFAYYKKYYFFLTKKLKYTGIENDLAAAMHIVIVDEIGINPTPLYKLKVSVDKKASKSKHEFIKIEDDGSVRFNVIKWRQKRLQKRSTETSSLISPDDMNPRDINASFCIQFAIALTEQKRRELKTNLLWLKKSQKRLTKHTPFDYKFRIFCNKNLPPEFSVLKPTLMRVRSSRAIEIYIRTEGDVVAVATYLGNKICTTLDTYIPTFLQEIMYRRKISVFQHIYLILATSTESEKLKLLGLSQSTYDKSIMEIYKNKDFGGPLFEKLKPDVKNEEDVELEYFFICSIENLAYIINFLKYTENDGSEFYNLSLNTLNKVSSGSIQHKKMIRDAERLLDAKGKRHE
jgi:hypothetical protein